MFGNGGSLDVVRVGGVFYLAVLCGWVWCRFFVFGRRCGRYPEIRQTRKDALKKALDHVTEHGCDQHQRYQYNRVLAVIDIMQLECLHRAFLFVVQSLFRE